MRRAKLFYAMQMHLRRAKKLCATHDFVAQNIITQRPFAQRFMRRARFWRQTHNALPFFSTLCDACLTTSDKAVLRDVFEPALCKAVLRNVGGVEQSQ